MTAIIIKINLKSWYHLNSLSIPRIQSSRILRDKRGKNQNIK